MSGALALARDERNKLDKSVTLGLVRWGECSGVSAVVLKDMSFVLLVIVCHCCSCVER